MPLRGIPLRPPPRSTLTAAPRYNPPRQPEAPLPRARLIHRLTPLLLAILTRAALAADPSPLDRGHWLVRDVAADSAWTDTPAPLHIDLQHTIDPTHHTWSATVTDTTATDRAVTLAFSIPLDATGWTWHDDPQTSRPIPPNAAKSFSNQIPTSCGSTGTASLYPLAVLSLGPHTLVLAVPPQPARMVRFLYDPARKELRAEFDFGLSPLPTRFPSRADATVLSYELDSQWPFRAALEHYWSLFPDAFARRPNTPAGIWLPFNDIRTIKNPADFSIAAHECADQQLRGPDAKPFCDADAAAGCQTFPYVEPPTYWQQYNGPTTAGYTERLAQLKDEAAHGSLIAQSTLVSGIRNADGTRDLYLGKVAYTTQAPWGSDPNPDIPASAKAWPSKGQYELTRLLSFFPTSPSPTSPPLSSLGGVYVDSLEGWGTILNYNHDHWKVTRFPLTFDPATKKVCLWNFWGTYSFVSDLSQRLHADHKLLMANDAYFHFWFPFPHVDIPGREYTWTDKSGHLAPVPDDRYLFFKSMAGRRPYLMLMNNRYDDPTIMEPYFQRSLFYAVYPSMFSGQTSAGDVAYFSNPAWYNRDRPLFKKYLPLIRQLDLAGWHPVPHATATPAETRLERYGSWDEGNLAFTLHNPTDHSQDITLTLDPAPLHLPPTFTATERITNHPLPTTNHTLRLTLPAQGYADIGITP